MSSNYEWRLGLENSARRMPRLEHEMVERARTEAERLRLERQMVQTQKLESLGVLTAGVAYDFNNLLAWIPTEPFGPNIRVSAVA